MRPRLTAEDGEIRVRTYTSGAAVHIEIKDNGCGIAEEHLDSIFNPFFTTKDVGEGTGLGLSISYAIVEKHGGDIQVASELGVGTTFTISLPVEGSRGGCGMTSAAAGARSPTEEQPVAGGVILFVDDERQILSSLKRLARRLGYKALIANGGQEGLDVLEANEVDIIVSDMRMPKMTGAEFLEQVAKRWPSTMRILLTGYSDIESAVSAVNDGQIFRYLNKPWRDEDIESVLGQALEIRSLAKEKDRLEKLTQAQNEELASLNSTLERKVEERTAQVKKAAQLLANANAELRESYATTVDVFANLIRSSRDDAKDTRGVAERAQDTARAMGLSQEVQSELRMAGMLCELGKLTLPDEIVNRPYVELSPDECKRFQEHPVIAETVLLPLAPMERVASVLRSHCEYLDGSGFPNGLEAGELAVEVRILTVCNDFFGLITGQLLSEELTVPEALDYLTHHSERYDPEVVKAFKRVTRKSEDRTVLAEGRVTTAGLRPGHLVTRDFYNRQGVLVLPAGLRLKAATIEKLKRIEKEQGDELVIHVTSRR